MRGKRRHISGKKASWDKGPGAVLLQDTPTIAEYRGGFHEARLPTAALPARLARAVPVGMAVGLQCGDSVGQSAGAGSWPWRLAVVRVVLWPKAQAFQKGKKEKQSCGCWESSRFEDEVLPLSLRARLRRTGELSARA